MPETDLWEDDLLNREKEGEFLIKFLEGRYTQSRMDPFVLNINAEWGFGKSYFLKNLALALKDKEYNVIEFDAWKNDYTKEPLLAFISEVNSSLSDYLSDEDGGKVKDFLNSAKKIILPIAVKKLTGFAVDEIEEQLKSDIDSDIEKGVSSLLTKTAEIALKEHSTIKNSIVDFKEKLKLILVDLVKAPLFIFIDELDRCRPNYSIELL